MGFENAPIMPIRGANGYWVTPDGRKFQLVNYREDVMYDTLFLAAGLQVTGRIPFLQNWNNKRLNDTNFSGSIARLPGGQAMIVQWVGFKVVDCFANTIALPRDIKRVTGNLYVDVSLAGFKQCEGPLERFNTPFGLTGNTTENDAGIVSLGVPSPAAFRPLEQPVYMDSTMDFEAGVTFDNHFWALPAPAVNLPTLDRALAIRIYFGGIIGKPATQSPA